MMESRVHVSRDRLSSSAIDKRFGSFGENCGRCNGWIKTRRFFLVANTGDDDDGRGGGVKEVSDTERMRDIWRESNNHDR